MTRIVSLCPAPPICILRYFHALIINLYRPGCLVTNTLTPQSDYQQGHTDCQAFPFPPSPPCKLLIFMEIIFLMQNLGVEVEVVRCKFMNSRYNTKIQWYWARLLSTFARSAIQSFNQKSCFLDVPYKSNCNNNLIRYQNCFGQLALTKSNFFSHLKNFKLLPKFVL